MIRCASTDRALHLYFLRVADAVLATFGEQPTGREVTQAIDHLVELFHAVEQPARKSLQGLWAEVFLIARAADPAALVEAWHGVSTDRYDFMVGSQRIEVKSTAGSTREHHFSLEQLHPPEGTEVLIASLSLNDKHGDLA